MSDNGGPIYTQLWFLSAVSLVVGGLIGGVIVWTCWRCGYLKYRRPGKTSRGPVIDEERNIPRPVGAQVRLAQVDGVSLERRLGAQGEAGSMRRWSGSSATLTNADTTFARATAAREASEAAESAVAMMKSNADNASSSLVRRSYDVWTAMMYPSLIRARYNPPPQPLSSITDHSEPPQHKPPRALPGPLFATLNAIRSDHRASVATTATDLSFLDHPDLARRSAMKVGTPLPETPRSSRQSINTTRSSKQSTLSSKNSIKRIIQAHGGRAPLMQVSAARKVPAPVSGAGVDEYEGESYRVSIVTE
ncbi:hypothetical protein BJ742DRAFT_801100 [Cladochytrium replicatum]|nr:hypothetical protein BJ742DRAFT_801100 [Cladochytrium replicatum]